MRGDLRPDEEGSPAGEHRPEEDTKLGVRSHEEFSGVREYLRPEEDSPAGEDSPEEGSLENQN
jgi:hypothetical protein